MIKDIPQQFDESANMSVDINVIISRESEEEAFLVVKKSNLPREVIDYLISDGDFISVLTKAGFGMGFIDSDNKIIQWAMFKEVLGTYTKDFLNIIAPFVPADSYIEIETKDDFLYRWKFDGSTCKKIHQKMIWE